MVKSTVMSEQVTSSSPVQDASLRFFVQADVQILQVFSVGTFEEPVVDLLVFLVQRAPQFHPQFHLHCIGHHNYTIVVLKDVGDFPGNTKEPSAVFS